MNYIREIFHGAILLLFMVMALMILWMGASGCGSTRSSAYPDGRPPREFILNFKGPYATSIPFGKGIVKARARGEDIPLSFNTVGYARYEDSIEISLTLKGYEFFHAVLPPVGSGHLPDTHVVELQEPGREFYHGPRLEKVQYICYGSYLHVMRSDTSTLESVQELLDSIGLRRLSGLEMGGLGIFNYQFFESERRIRSIDYFKGDDGPMIVVKKRGGIFDRFNCSELRALRSSPLIAGAAPYGGIRNGEVQSWSNQLHLHTAGPPSEQLKSFLARNGFRIDIAAPMSALYDTYLLVVHTDDGVGSGLWEIIDWLRIHAGISASIPG